MLPPHRKVELAHWRSLLVCVLFGSVQQLEAMLFLHFTVLSSCREVSVVNGKHSHCAILLAEILPFPPFYEELGK